MRIRNTLVLSAATAMIGLAAGGCYNEVETQPAGDVRPDQPAGTVGGSASGGGASSSLGKARQSAEGTASDLQQRSQEIADGIDGY